jgi:hypothetical protein
MCGKVIEIEESKGGGLGGGGRMLANYLAKPFLVIGAEYPCQKTSGKFG